MVFADFGEALPFVTVPKDDGDNYCEYFGHARGTEAIQSPEMLQHSNERTLKITSASDIWSLGALLYELLGERMLFEQGKRCPINATQQLLRCLLCFRNLGIFIHPFGIAQRGVLLSKRISDAKTSTYRLFRRILH